MFCAAEGMQLTCSVAPNDPTTTFGEYEKSKSGARCFCTALVSSHAKGYLYVLAAEVTEVLEAIRGISREGYFVYVLVSQGNICKKNRCLGFPLR